MMNFFSEKKTDKEELIDDNVDDKALSTDSSNQKTNFDLTEVFSHLRTKQEQQQKGLER